MIMNMTLYRLLKQFGATEADAETGAQLDALDLVTRADLRVEMATLRAEMADMRTALLQWGIGILFTGLALQAGLIIFAVSRLVRP
jgi:hypothetical protein